MDGVKPEIVDEARRAAETAGGVAVPLVRGRWTGRALHLEVHPRLAPGTSLAEVERVAEEMRRAVLGALRPAATVTVVPEVPGGHGRGGVA